MDSKIPPHYYISMKARELEKQGVKVTHLEVGEPYIETDREIIDEMCKRAYMGYTHYGSIYGIDELRYAIADYMNKCIGGGFTEDNVILIPGSKISIFLLSYTLLRDRRNILVLTPTWAVYIMLLKDMGYNVIEYKLKFENKWILDSNDIEYIKTLNIDAFLIVNPSNPTGVILPKDNIKAIVDIARERNAYIFADEIYFNLVFNGYKFHSFLSEDYDKVIGIYSFSKAYAMTGFRIGWMIARSEIIKTIASKMQLILSNIPEFTQYAALKALSREDIVERNRRIFMNRIMKLSKGLRSIGFQFIEPMAGLYIFTRAPKGFKDGFDFAIKLLNEEHIAVAPGTAFGDYPEYIRFSASVDEEQIDNVILKISKFIEKYL